MTNIVLNCLNSLRNHKVHKLWAKLWYHEEIWGNVLWLDSDISTNTSLINDLNLFWVLSQPNNNLNSKYTMRKTQYLCKCEHKYLGISPRKNHTKENPKNKFVIESYLEICSHSENFYPLSNDQQWNSKNGNLYLLNLLLNFSVKFIPHMPT